MSGPEILDEGGVPIYAWTKGVQVEDAAREQLAKISRLPVVFDHIAVMPDVHLGIGATVGSVVPTKGAIIPSAVGVDIGCVDMDSEYLSPKGWCRIAEYDGGPVMQYDPETGEGQFVEPRHFIKRPSTSFLHFKTKYGIDQMLSPDHKVLCWKITGRKRERVMTVMTAQELAQEHRRLVIGAKVEFQTTFEPVVKTRLPLSDAAIRLQVAVHADGCLVSQTTCQVNLVKDRKKVRLRQLLHEADVAFTEHDYDDRTAFRFAPPMMTKSYGEVWWTASAAQLQVIADECLHWDGNMEDRVFFTRDKASADFIQYAFTASGSRGTLRSDVDKVGDVDYRVFANTNVLVGLGGAPKSEVRPVPSVDGFEYCFTVPSGFWVMRRGGNVVMTGNCGMVATRTSLKASDLPENLGGIRSAIERAVPHGRTSNGVAGQDRGAWGSLPGPVDAAWKAGLHARWQAVVDKHPKAAAKNTVHQLGTLGGGNHFVEVCLDEEQHVWVMLHSGSRGLGNRFGEYFIELAKEDMGHLIHNLPDKDLAYLTEGTEHFKDYVEAVSMAQDFARVNREIMMDRTLGALRNSGVLPPFQWKLEAINCHHNYVQKETHLGEEVFVTRKGAVRAGLGDMGIIPGSMGAKSFIVRGKGCAEAFHSCSHGAGRKMSRTQAKKTFTLEDHVKATEGVECRKDADVIDETPAAYKSIDDVMAAQADLVEIVHTLKQIVCVKG